MNFIIVLLLTILMLLGFVRSSFGEIDKAVGYQQYFHYSDSYPDDVSNNGFVNNVQGIAHDDNYWYITVEDALWKIPVTQTLYGVDVDTPGVSMVTISQITCPYGGVQRTLAGLGYNHFGDLVAYNFDNNYYLLVPIENGTPGYAIAVFRAEDLACLGFDILRINYNNPPLLNNAAGWCATDNGGNVYTSPDYWSLSEWNGEVKLLKYSLNWDTLGSDPQYPVQMTFLGTIPLMDENGMNLTTDTIAGPAQGGEFSPDGKLLYVSCGYYEMDDDRIPYGGIHVFETNTWKRVARSSRDANALFRYDFYPITIPWVAQEPQGLTIWDLEEQRASYLDLELPPAPFVQGQLHVLLLRNGVTGDSLYLRNYTNTTYVDYSAYGFTPDGTISRPFNTVGDALALYNQNFNFGHWTGGRIKIHTGSYPEALTFSGRMQIVPWSGKAVVGSQGRVALTPGGAINIQSSGALKLH